MFFGWMTQRSPFTFSSSWSFAGFAAGLSLDFLSDDALVSVPMDQLTKFKEKTHGLLEKHQFSILEVAQKYHVLGEGQDFLDALTDLRLQAAKQRQELDEEGRDAWLSIGFEIVKKAVLAASGGAIAGIAVLRGHNLTDLIGVGVPALVSGVGVAAVATIETLEKIHKLRLNSMAYLFEAQKLLSGRKKQDEANTILAQCSKVDNAGESRQFPTEGSKLLYTFLFSSAVSWFSVGDCFRPINPPFRIVKFKPLPQSDGRMQIPQPNLSLGMTQSRKPEVPHRSAGQPS